MDQCPAHPQDLPTFNNTKVVFFPANCASKIQPLDLSVIRCAKVHYRKTIIRRQDWHIVSDGLATCTFNKFFDVDENLMTSQLREIGNIATEINGGEEEEEEDNDNENDAAKFPPTHTVALEILRDYFQFISGSEGTFSSPDELEKTLFENSREQKQSSTVNCFVRE
ncbi:hypothetical protein AVEN_166686-1 [Araneus ventricosus]|uniref:DDE-1 domain-containing protein n=1 Tax=Araneus ventricosus TaxID=182803 RepID=A0A4Y2HGF8_ARAVE|nr:hypothetical protein AVEN_166686-1 [Araneus ventricosus]